MVPSLRTSTKFRKSGFTTYRVPCFGSRECQLSCLQNGREVPNSQAGWEDSTRWPRTPTYSKCSIRVFWVPKQCLLGLLPVSLGTTQAEGVGEGETGKVSRRTGLDPHSSEQRARRWSREKQPFLRGRERRRHLLLKRCNCQSSLRS